MPDLQGDHSRPQDLARPSVPGVYDALRGGHRHLAVEGKIADALERAFPGTGARMLEERDFTMRAVAWAADRGTRQFIVADAGMPAPAGHNIHETAQAAQPGSVTVYVSAHPYAAAWTRALLAEGDPLVASVEASVSAPGRVFGDPGLTRMIDFTRPVCVIAPMVLHLASAPLARRMLRGLAAPLAPGSTVAVSAWSGASPEENAEFRRLFRVCPIWRHQPAVIARWMTAAGLGIVPQPRDRHPGVVDARLWPRQVWAAGQLPGRPAGRIVVAVGVRE